MVMKKAYVTFLTPTHDDDDTYLVEVPDLEILTEGHGLEEAIYMARDAIGIKGIYMEDEGQNIPEPTSINEVDESKATYKDVGKCIVTLVDIDFYEYRKKVDNKSVRRNVTIPNWLNKKAEEENLNVSRVLQEALMEKLGTS